MPPEEKQAVWDNLDWMYEIGKKIKTLPEEEQPSKEEQAKYTRCRNKNLDDRYAFGVKQGFFEKSLLEEFHISRDDIKAGVKNPYGSKILKRILVAILFILACVVVRITGFSFYQAVIAGLGFSVGIFAIAAVSSIVKFCKFKKLQDLYRNGGTEEEEISAEVYKLLVAEWNKKS